MKFTLAIVALAGLAAAAPAEEKRGACTPATYDCTANKDGWQVCDTSGNWVFAGYCPPNTACVFFPPSKSPYCVPPGFTIPS